MRAVTYCDIIQAARILRCRPREQWGREARRGLYKAHCADLYRKQFGKAHPYWGNGTLAAAFAEHPSLVSLPNGASDSDAIEAVIHAVWSWRCQQNLKRQARPLRFELERLSGKMRQP